LRKSARSRLFRTTLPSWREGREGPEVSPMRAFTFSGRWAKIAKPERARSDGLQPFVKLHESGGRRAARADELLDVAAERVRAGAPGPGVPC